MIIGTPSLTSLDGLNFLTNVSSATDLGDPHRYLPASSGSAEISGRGVSCEGREEDEGRQIPDLSFVPFASFADFALLFGCGSAVQRFSGEFAPLVMDANGLPVTMKLELSVRSPQ